MIKGKLLTDEEYVNFKTRRAGILKAGTIVHIKEVDEKRKCYVLKTPIKNNYVHVCFENVELIKEVCYGAYR